MHLTNTLSNLSGALLKPVMKRMSRGRLPQLQGQIDLPGLELPVTVVRDRWGIPTIKAQNRRDLLLAQGFVHAQDRLWQMEIHRRAAAGSLAAMVGPFGLETDRLSRTLGFHRLAEATWRISCESVRSDVEAYTAGVNAYLQSGQPLPLEFTLLRHRPEPWTPFDSVAFGRLMAWILSHGFAHKVVRAQIIDRVGPEAAAELEPFYPEDNPVTLPNGIEFNLLEADGFMRSVHGPFLRRGLEGVGRGSNAWVLSGQRTASGQPILCNDMHLPISAPSLWYVMCLSCPDASGQKGLRVVGATLPGIPYILVGHNQHIAWGATVSFVDNEDLFVERFGSGNRLQYEFEGRWRQAERIEERIAVRGRPDHVETVTATHHGPLISDVLSGNGQALALASRSLAPDRSFDGFALLNEARDWDEFVAAIQRIESPTLNLVYADVGGNIGYYVTGRVPIRRTGAGQVPVPGWTGDHEWLGDIPFEEMPHALNPAAGFLVSANNKIVDENYSYYLGVAWRNGYRARRIADLILETKKFSLQDNQRLQADLHNVPGVKLATYLQDLNPEDVDASLCLALLRDWDGRMTADSTGALVYKTLLGEISLAILQPKLGQSLTKSYLGDGPHPMLYPFGETYSQWIATLFRLLDQDESFWLPSGEERTTLLERCLAQTITGLRNRLGDESTQWTWGHDHQISFGHALSARRPLDQVFSLGPYVVGGDADTVCQVSIDPGSSANNIAPSFRQILDLGNWDNSLAMHTPGQSGQLASRHYADLVEPWLTGDYYRLSWDQAAGESTSGMTLRLLPVKTDTSAR